MEGPCPSKPPHQRPEAFGNRYLVPGITAGIGAKTCSPAQRDLCSRRQIALRNEVLEVDKCSLYVQAIKWRLPTRRIAFRVDKRLKS